MSSYDPQIKPESLALMNALLARTNIAATASAAFRTAYPDAPHAMIDAAIFHVVSEGIEATVDWLAAIETFLRDPSKSFDYGAVLAKCGLYHLYNWQQFQALMPLGRANLKEHLGDVSFFLKEGNSEAAAAVLERLMSAVSGDVAPPEVG